MHIKLEIDIDHEMFASMDSSELNLLALMVECHQMAREEIGENRVWLLHYRTDLPSMNEEEKEAALDRPIAAIKMYRERNRLGLVESKYVIEAYRKTAAKSL